MFISNFLQYRVLPKERRIIVTEEQVKQLAEKLKVHDLHTGTKESPKQTKAKLTD